MREVPRCVYVEKTLTGSKGGSQGSRAEEAAEEAAAAASGTSGHSRVWAACVDMAAETRGADVSQDTTRGYMHNGGVDAVSSLTQCTRLAMKVSGVSLLTTAKGSSWCRGSWGRWYCRGTEGGMAAGG